MRTLRIDRLRPTQFTHGMREIRDKTKAYRSLTGHDLQMAIAEKPVPVVLGPDGARSSSTITTSPLLYGART